MTRLLIGLGIFLIAWGVFVLVTGDFVATVDIAAGLVASGVGVIALSAVVRSLDRIANLLVERNEQRSVLAQQAQARPAAERPRGAVQPPQAEMPPAPAAERRSQVPAHPQLEPVERPQPEPERRPEPAAEQRRSAPAPEAGPKLIREGIIEGQHYRFFEDGSIEAEGPGGVRRFRSIDEAREQIMRDRAGPPPQGQKPAAVPDARRPPEDAQRSRPPADAPGKPQQDLTWDAYLSGGRSPEGEPPRPPLDDDQWSEPFRMLLRGDAPPPDQKPSKR